jgi:hypothetical protein
VPEAPILDAPRERLMAPELVATFVADVVSEWNLALAGNASNRDDTSRELAAVDRKLKGPIDAIADGFRVKGRRRQLDEMEAHREALTASLDAPAPVVPHPRIHRRSPKKGFRRRPPRRAWNGVPPGQARCLTQTPGFRHAAGGHIARRQLPNDFAVQTHRRSSPRPCRSLSSVFRPRGRAVGNPVQRHPKISGMVNLHQRDPRTLKIATPVRLNFPCTSFE